MTITTPSDAAVDAETGPANFTELHVVFDRLEWLWLSHEGHRRSVFT